MKYYCIPNGTKLMRFLFGKIKIEMSVGEWYFTEDCAKTYKEWPKDFLVETETEGSFFVGKDDCYTVEV